MTNLSTPFCPLAADPLETPVVVLLGDGRALSPRSSSVQRRGSSDSLGMCPLAADPLETPVVVLLGDGRALSPRSSSVQRRGSSDSLGMCPLAADPLETPVVVLLGDGRALSPRSSSVQRRGSSDSLGMCPLAADPPSNMPCKAYAFRRTLSEWTDSQCWLSRHVAASLISSASAESRITALVPQKVWTSGVWCPPWLCRNRPSPSTCVSCVTPVPSRSGCWALVGSTGSRLDRSATLRAGSSRTSACGPTVSTRSSDTLTERTTEATTETADPEADHRA